MVSVDADDGPTSAVAFLAVRSFSGSDRGEANPDDAVNTMIASIADENPVELVNSIAPSELSFFGDVEAAAANTVDGDGVAADSLEERGITINGEDLVPGLTLELADLTYVVEEKSDDVAKVTVNSVSGNWTFDPKVLLDAVDLDQLTGGEVTEEDALEDIEEADISGGSFDLDDLDFTDEGVFFMAVREDGGWFVSPMYTLLEYVVEVQDLPEGDFDEPVVTGAATPQEAVEQSVSAVFAFAIEGDFSGIIDSLPPNRYAALYAYRDALEELTGREGIEDAERLDIDVDVQEIQEFDDERGLGVTIDKASVEMTADGGDRTVRFEIDGKCATNTRIEDGDEDTQEFCLDDFGEGAGPFEDGIPGIDKFWVIVTEDDGQFFVDPLASLGSYIAAANVQQIADDVSEMIEEQAEDDVDDTDPTEPADATDTTDGSATTEPAGTDG